MSHTTRRFLLPNGDVAISTEGDREHLAWFERELAQAGVRLDPNSALARGLAAFRWFIGETDERDPDSPEFVRRVFATAYLVRATRRAATTPSWPAIAAGWLRELNRGDVGLVGFEASDPDGSRDRAFELLVATLMAQVAKRVHQAEPDVVGDYKGERFGVACKLVYTQKLNQQVNVIMNGVKQLEDSDCESGVVMVNVTALLQHDRIMPAPTRRTEDGDPIYDGSTRGSVMTEIVRQLNVIASPLRESGELRSRIAFDRNTRRARTKAKAIFLFAQTVGAFNLDPVTRSALGVADYTVIFGVPTALAPLHVRDTVRLERGVRRLHRDLEDVANSLASPRS